MEAIISYHPAYHTDTAQIAAGPPRAKCKAINDPAISKYPHAQQWRAFLIFQNMGNKEILRFLNAEELQQNGNIQIQMSNSSLTSTWGSFL